MRPAYEPKQWEDVNCPFCESDNRKPYDTFGHRLQYTYVQCQNCSLIYQSPRPKYDQDFLEAAYGGYHSFEPNYEYSKTELQEFGLEVEEIVRFDMNRTIILEIGSCMGPFLKASMPHYTKVEGLEISEEMAAFSEKKLGVDVFRQQFEELNTNQKYSCIHMSHVIEHIPNPNEWMQKAAEVLDEDGVLVICVPNMYSLSRRIQLLLKRVGLKKGKWKEAWRTPDHLFEPTIKSMKYLFEKNKFEILDFYTYSRKDPTSEKGMSRIMHRGLKIGSNLRFYLRRA